MKRQRAGWCVSLAWGVVAFLIAWAWIVPTTRASVDRQLAQPAGSWAQAQAAERRTLTAELEALRRGLSSARTGNATAKAALRKEIDTLATRLTQLRVRNDQLQRGLPAREQTRSLEAQERDLQDLVSRLRSRLTTDSDSDAPLPQIVRALLSQVRRSATLAREPDTEYFGTDGTPQTAQVVRIGRVAAARWDDPAVPLIETAQGLQEPTGLDVNAQERGAALVATFVLQDPEDPPALDGYQTAGWRAQMDAGGSIMWVLLAIGLAALVVVVERTISLSWSAARWRLVQRRFANAVHSGQAHTLADTRGWLAKPLVVAVGSTPEANDTAEERATQALMVMREHLLRRLSLVNVAAGVAPLLGLLGTVTGMIHTFSVVTSTATSEPQQLAVGISEALLTTQFGLAIAIPAFLAHALLTRAARRVLASAEQTVLWYLHGSQSGLSDALHESGPEPDPDPAAAQEGHGR